MAGLIRETVVLSNQHDADNPGVLKGKRLKAIPQNVPSSASWVYSEKKILGPPTR
ncbi:conserved hypothetical protein [Culex quinquefasciatus]|uniref:Uncharacterized protein n=1 Tax=Culex quinquefasciatus TaxID=7176 RepID=B0XK66_CULQU|nr:conserved hypothetical protein [Culex quinquefasciatus]|eukprot:XP_001870038.1 conserved hypothetical protein [Culex quinquefasciatus]